MNIQEHNRAIQDELGSLRHTISTLDKEKDKLLSTLDEKTVECVTLKQELASKHHRLDELNSQLSQLESSFDTATSHLNSQKKVKWITFKIMFDFEVKVNCSKIIEKTIIF